MNYSKLIIGLFIGALCLYVVARPFQADKTDHGFNLKKFGQLPILANGRIKSVDALARNSLLRFHHRGYANTAEGEKVTPAHWAARVFFTPAKSEEDPVFLVYHPDLLEMLGAGGETKKRFTFAEILEDDRDAELLEQAREAEQEPAAFRSRFQRAVIDLTRNVIYYNRDLTNAIWPVGWNISDPQTGQRAIQMLAEHKDRTSIFAVPPNKKNAPTDDWMRTGTAIIELVPKGEDPKPVKYWGTMAQAWIADKPEVFNKELDKYYAWLKVNQPEALKTSRTEAVFAQIAPFEASMALYIIAFLAAAASWMTWPNFLARAALLVAFVALLIHTGGLGVRMIIQDRPPVTNLYSSAVFIGWGTVILALILEWVMKNGLATAAASAVGFVTLMIAYGLSLDGDTLEMMRAVLDDNFWLGTHVVVITLGYSAAFLAGFLAIIGIFVARFARPGTGVASGKNFRLLSKIVYGVVCFCLLFSFVGTILGGIWADQSWGRFWGWDPKENGALMIVLWTAIMLHARWGGMVRERGIFAMAIVGNIIVSWSWFGTNMLNVGLHSYGFTDAAFWWLIIFVISQLIIIAIAFTLPPSLVRKAIAAQSSHKEDDAASPGLSGGNVATAVK